ncbi:MAG: hypothetical protein KGO49_14085 [Gammaproteobacteria bacterium]|nr:hypothetical protein [Gammaproteobacteria bacterium]
MHIKFLRHGTGSPQLAAEYLLKSRDYKNVLRAEVTVLRGDPLQFSAVASSLPFSQRYTSGVIAWSPNDQPTDLEIDAVLNAYERLARGGL